MPSELDTLKAAGNIATDCGEKLHQLTYPKFVGWHVEMRLASPSQNRPPSVGRPEYSFGINRRTRRVPRPLPRML